MTQTTTIAVSISPLGKLLQDYLSQHIFAEFLPSNNKQNIFVLNYFESIKQSKKTKLYYNLIFASILVFVHPLLSFSLPFPYLDEEKKLNELKRMQRSRWHFVRIFFDLLKTHSVYALFKDNTKHSPTASPSIAAFKSTENSFDYIVIGKEGSPATHELVKAGKKVLHIGKEISNKNVLLKRPPREFEKCLEIQEAEIELAMNAAEREILVDECAEWNHSIPEAILFEKGKAVAVQTGNMIFTAKDGIVLAGGAVETPALLLRSELKNPQIGKNLSVQIAIHCLGLLSETRSQAEGDANRVEISQFEKNGIYLLTCQNTLEEMLVKIPYIREEINTIKNKYTHLTSWMGTIKAKAKGSVGITSSGVPHLFFTPTYEDMETVRAATNKLCQILFQLNAIEVYPNLSGPLNTLKNANQTGELRAISPQPQYFKMDYLHQFGTCHMGKDPRTSVVDSNFKVRGTENLYCTDTSILPFSTGVDPALTVKALSKIAVGKILKKNHQTY